MSLSTAIRNAVETANQFAKVGDFNDYLRCATDDELALQASRIQDNLDALGDQRNSVTDVLRERLTALKSVLGHVYA